MSAPEGPPRDQPANSQASPSATSSLGTAVPIRSELHETKVAEAREYWRQVHEHYKDRPDHITTFHILLGKYTAGTCTETMLYIMFYAFFHSTDSLNLLPGFRSFMPATWSSENLNGLEPLHHEIVSSLYKYVRWNRLSDWAMSVPSGAPGPDISTLPTGPITDENDSDSGDTTTNTSEPAPQAPNPTPIASSLERAGETSGNTISQPNTSIRDPKPYPSARRPDQHTETQKRVKGSEPVLPANAVEPLFTPSHEEKARSLALLTSYVQRAMDAQSGVYVSEERRAEGLILLKQFVEIALARHRQVMLEREGHV